VFTIEDLESLMPPPYKPVGVGSPNQWRALARQIGIDLPPDFKQLLAVYGAGDIESRFRIASPFLTDGVVQLLKEYRAHGSRRTLPSGGRLVPWGYNFERGTAYWEVLNPNPRTWTIYTEFDGDIQRFNENTTTFLAKVLRGDQLSAVLFNEAKPFVPPVPFYPAFEPSALFAALGRPTVSWDQQVNIARHMFGKPAAIGPDVAFGPTFRELQARVPRTGWSIRFREYAHTGPRGASHELDIVVPKTEVRVALRRMHQFAQRLGVEIQVVRDGNP